MNLVMNKYIDDSQLLVRTYIFDVKMAGVCDSRFSSIMILQLYKKIKNRNFNDFLLRDGFTREILKDNVVAL